MIQYLQINECDNLKKLNKNHMITSRDAEKVFDKIQHPFKVGTAWKTIRH